MKIKVADLEPNPYRDLDSNYFDEERIEGLRDSMLKDDFWGGIPVRPHPTKKGKYQIGACHHRVECLRRNGIKEVEITCIVPYSDARMIRIMVNENAQFEPRPKLVNADIELIKSKLQGWLDQYDTWEEARLDTNIQAVFSNENQWATPKGRGVGRTTIKNYLGKTYSYKDWVIRQALATLRDEKAGTLDREALEIIPTIDAANHFRQAVKTSKIPKKSQRKIAEKIIKEKVPAVNIPDLIAEHPLAKREKKKSELKSLPMLDDYIKDTCGIINSLYGRLQHIKDNLVNIQSKRLKETFMRDGKELTALMERIFKDETEKTKRILQSSSQSNL